MNQRKTLIAATLGEVLLLVGVLAGYLIAIAARLRNVSKTLGSVTFGVRAIETQTAPVGPRLREINGALEQVATALKEVVGEAAEDDAQRTTHEQASPGTMESSGEAPSPTSP